MNQQQLGTYDSIRETLYREIRKGEKTMSKSLQVSINGVVVEWNERSMRVLRPCVKCGEPTKGRFVSSGGREAKPADIACAVSIVMGRAFGPGEEARNA